MTRRKAIFLDKDGTLVVDVPYNAEPALITLTPGAGEGLRALAADGYDLIVVTNQSGIARGKFTTADLERVKHRLDRLLTEEGVSLAGFHYCPHHPEGVVPEYSVHCGCRKPKPGLLVRAAVEHGVDLGESWVIGDILDDVEAGRRAGCRTVLLVNGGETEWVPGRDRSPDVSVRDLAEAASAILEAGSTSSDFSWGCRG